MKKNKWKALNRKNRRIKRFAYFIQNHCIGCGEANPMMLNIMIQDKNKRLSLCNIKKLDNIINNNEGGGIVLCYNCIACYEAFTKQTYKYKILYSLGIER